MSVFRPSMLPAVPHPTNDLVTKKNTRFQGFHLSDLTRKNISIISWGPYEKVTIGIRAVKSGYPLISTLRLTDADAQSHVVSSTKLGRKNHGKQENTGPSRKFGSL